MLWGAGHRSRHPIVKRLAFHADGGEVESADESQCTNLVAKGLSCSSISEKDLLPIEHLLAPNWCNPTLSLNKSVILLSFTYLLCNAFNNNILMMMVPRTLPSILLPPRE